MAGGIFGFITIFFLGIFSLLYISKAIGAKSEGMRKAADRITDNIDNLAFFGLIYGVLAAFLSPILIQMNMVFILVSLLSNLTIVVMALPFAFERMIKKKEETMNAAILDGLREIVAGIAARQKVLGFVGAGLATVMFLLILGA